MKLGAHGRAGARTWTRCSVQWPQPALEGLQSSLFGGGGVNSTHETLWEGSNARHPQLGSTTYTNLNSVSGNQLL